MKILVFNNYKKRLILYKKQYKNYYYKNININNK